MSTVTTTRPATATAAITINPATGDVLAAYPFLNLAGLQNVLEQSTTGFHRWRAVQPTERCAVLRRMAELLRRDVDALAELIVAEMGKPIAQSWAEVHKSADTLDWYSDYGPAMVADTTTAAGKNVIVRHQPLGPVLAVEPWNFPVWQCIRSAAAILIAGNSYILKPAPNVAGCAFFLERLWQEAGLPAGSFTVLNADIDVVAAAIAHPAVVGVTVTGSVRAGSAIAAQAGKMIKPSVLELGGTDAFIVLADADIDAAVNGAITGRFQNSGQVCIASKRIILHKSIEEEFTQKFIAAVARLRVGDPRDPGTVIGPIARPDLRDEIAEQVARTIAQGGKLLHGGNPLEGPGNFFEPTVISNVRPGMVAFDEEVFGPVAALTTAQSADDAISLANTSKFGLSASVWTRETDKAADIAGRLEVGGVFINKVPVSDPRIPIGGVKNSGFGRELSTQGVHAFTNVQTVWVEEPPGRL